MRSLPGTIRVFGICAYCNTPISRTIPPSKQIPSMMYCNQECRLSAIREENEKIKQKTVQGRWNRKFHQLHDPEWLRANIPGRSFTDIAAELGCGYDTVRKAAKKHGIKK